MLGSTTLTAILGAAPPATAENARLKAFAKTATAAGLALLLIAPGTKLPVDMRSPIQKRKDDEQAQDAAKAAGRSDWTKAKSLAGSHLATTDPTLIGRYIDKYRKTYGDECAVNFAIEVGRSNIVIVDCDTDAQLRAFLSDAEIDFDLPPTVRTPGVLNEDGTWAHSEGGHYYFTPETELPTGSGSITMPGEYVIMWHDRYVLIPPSVRPEGPYVLSGREYPLPEWIAERVVHQAEERAARRLALENREIGELDQNIDNWAETVSWDDILAPAGWSMTARADKCGCAVWTAPGDHGSPKSATTHDTGCSLGRYTEVNAPMHIWTDNPGEDFEAWIASSGSKTLSKLQAVAVTTYKGDVGTACAEIGVLQGGTAIEAETGVDAKNIGHESGVDASNMGDIELPDRAGDPDAAMNDIADMGQTNVGGQIITDPEFADHAAGLPKPDLVLTRDDQGQPVIEPDVGQPAIEQVDAVMPTTALIRCERCEKDFPRGRFIVVDGNVIHDTATIDKHPRLLSIEWPASEGKEQAIEPEAEPNDQSVTEHVDEHKEDGDRQPDLGFTPPPTDPPEETPFSSEGDPEDDDVLNSESNGVPRIAPFKYWRDRQPPEYAVDGLIENRALTCIIGRPGIGKSVVAIDIACSLVRGIRWQGRKTIRQKVLYLPGEGLDGAVQRIIAWEMAHELNVGEDLIVGDSIIQLAAKKEDWAEVAGYILKHRVGLIIFDTFARMSLGLEENSASDVGKAITRFDQIRKLTGAGVLVVHHTGKTGSSGRGSNALNGALDSELLITDPQWDVSNIEGEGLELTTSKQKNAPRLRDPLPLVLTAMHDSVVLTGPTGIVGDPLDSVAVAPLLVPEPLVESAIRLMEYAKRFPSQGVTRGELVLGVQADEYTLARKNGELRWKLTVAEAVDLGLRYGLIETLTGRATGTRYIESTTTPDAARRRAADEAMAGD